ncbi:MAG: ABC transporter ATP-binding protein [Dehalococcoidia bacterium]|nr:ABC transporter ATP-binding protein [Dehalococcoidia bacterium]MDD5493125.1 ABC transporter ATP-binding protein [Dehalococcoidia bacterium]
MAILIANEATFGYGGNITLKSISLKSRPGELLGIIGPNGSGKTTLLKGLSGLLKALKGEVLFNSTDITRIEHRTIAKKIALVPQNAVLPDLFTALEIVLMGRTPHLGLLGHESEKDFRIALQAMKVTRTVHLVQRRINEISGGEKQRLIIARALAQEAEILLLDEPTANLDINYQVETFSVLHKLCTDSNLTVVTALHDLNLACQFCHRLIMLRDGLIYKQGTPSDIINSSSIEKVFDAHVQVYPHPVNSLPVTYITAVPERKHK